MAPGHEHVELEVINAPGVLGRVVGHIRREGWNIAGLEVHENPDSRTSHMQVDIEGTHTKIALVAERMLSLDCVLSVTTFIGGVRSSSGRKPLKEPAPGPADDTSGKDAPKPVGAARVLAVNPGSTSTKFAVYDDEKLVLSRTVNHASEDLEACGSVLGQKRLRKDALTRELARAGVSCATLDAVAGRGGLLRPIESGTYIINARMLEDLSSAAASVHASALGALIASEIAGENSVPAFVVDPIVVDEMDRNAKLTGIPGIERTSIFHALNHKAIARRLAGEMGKPYENCRLVVAHLGSGITVGAHKYGNVVDVNDALSGEGPFTPERSGSVPAAAIVRMCFSGEFSEEEMLDRIMRKGGMKAYLGTSDMQAAQKMIDGGDEFAALVVDSMAYQVAKAIGSMMAVLEGDADAIILTGGLAHSNRFTAAIKQRVSRLAPVHVFAGEDEMLALAQGALRVLRGKEQACLYQ